MSKTPSKVSSKSSSGEIVRSVRSNNILSNNNSQTSIARVEVQPGNRVFPDIFSRIRLIPDENENAIILTPEVQVNLPIPVPATTVVTQSCTVISKGSTSGRCGSAPGQLYQARESSVRLPSAKTSSTSTSAPHPFGVPTSKPSETITIKSGEKISNRRSLDRPNSKSSSIRIRDKSADQEKSSADPGVASAIREISSDSPTVISSDEPLSCTMADSVVRVPAVDNSAARRLLEQQQQVTAAALTGKARASLSLVSVGSCVCRICHTSAGRESLVSPCHCKGSLAYVHRACLERWLTQAGLGHCEVCLYQYNVEMTRRYGFLQALRLWVRLPRNRGLLQSDLLICTLFTVVTLGLITVFLVGARLFVLGGLKLGISRVWTHGAISFSLSILIVAYIINLYLIAKGQLGPWWAWWRSNVNVRLVLDDEMASHVITEQDGVRETEV